MFCPCSHKKWTDCPQHWSKIGKSPYSGNTTNGILHCLNCDSPKHQFYFLFAMVMCFVYPLGTPALYTLLLFKNRKELRRLKRFELQLQHKHQLRKLHRSNELKTEKTREETAYEEEQFLNEGDDTFREWRAASEAKTEEVLPKYMLKICGAYNVRTYWFEVADCVRKLMLIGLPIAFPPESPEQRTVGLIVCFISFGAFLSYQPYRELTDNKVEICCQMGIFFALLAGTFSGQYTNGIFDSVLVMGSFAPSVATFFYETPINDMRKERQYRRKKERYQRSLENAKNMRAQLLAIQFTIKLQRIWRGKQTRKEVLELAQNTKGNSKWAMVKLSIPFKRQLDRLRARKKELERQTAQASRLQKVWREKRQARRLVKSRKDAAARKLQLSWRKSHPPILGVRGTERHKIRLPPLQTNIVPSPTSLNSPTFSGSARLGSSRFPTGRRRNPFVRSQTSGRQPSSRWINHGYGHGHPRSYPHSTSMAPVTPRWQEMMSMLPGLGWLATPRNQDGGAGGGRHPHQMPRAFARTGHRSPSPGDGSHSPPRRRHSPSRAPRAASLDGVAAVAAAAASSRSSACCRASSSDNVVLELSKSNLLEAASIGCEPAKLVLDLAISQAGAPRARYESSVPGVKHHAQDLNGRHLLRQRSQEWASCESRQRSQSQTRVTSPRARASVGQHHAPRRQQQQLLPASDAYLPPPASLPPRTALAEPLSDTSQSGSPTSGSPRDEPF